MGPSHIPSHGYARGRTTQAAQEPACMGMLMLPACTGMSDAALGLTVCSSRYILRWPAS